MIAADVFKAFKEAGLENPEKQAVIGKRLVLVSVGGYLGALQRIFFLNPRLLWKWVGGSRSEFFIFGKLSPNSPKPVV